ncbi:hypothetical protein COEREDRAFT_79011, partial [Coemansia reversa NRRL 1564]
MSTEKCTLIPEQLFDSQDAFISHVKRFAVENGFNVRLDDVERDKGGVIRKRDIVCSSEGAPRGKDAKREDSAGRSDAESSEVLSPGKSAVAHSGAHRRKSMKTGCRWLARASRQPSGMWKIIMLRLEHNHPLATRYELMIPSAHNIRTGDNASISAAAIAARTAVENGTYAGPSAEFKNLFLQMSAACADLCWSAARHPETVPEVLSEIRRLNQHLDKHGGSVSMDDSGNGSAGIKLPTIAEDRPATTAETADAAGAAMATGGDVTRALDTNGSLVMMGRGASAAVANAGGHGMANSPLQSSRMIETPAQIIAQSQNRNIEPQSPELNAVDNMSSAAIGAVSESTSAVSAAQLSAVSGGPIKRSRGRPRKNPVGTDSKPNKSRAQQRREQQRLQQQHITQAQITPTPASLASLSQQIISQNAASSPASVQRPISSSLALPSQPIQSHVHQGGRTQIIGTDASIPSMLDARSHLGSVQRQQQQPQPQPHQSPTFFLGAAEGNGYPERPATAADTKSAALGTPTPAAATNAPPNVAANMGHTPPNFAQKPSAIRPAIAPAPTTNIPQHAAASATANASSTSNTVWNDGLFSSAGPTDTVVSSTAAAAAAVPRPAAVSAISDFAPNATSTVGAVAQSVSGLAAVDDRDHRLSLDAAGGIRHVDDQYAVDSPQLSVAGSISSAHNQAPAFQSYHSHPPPAGYHYAHPTYRDQQQQLHRQQQRHHVSMGSGLQPPTSAMGHLVLSSNSSVTSAAGYHSQIARMQQGHSPSVPADSATNQRAPLLSLSQTMQAAQQSRGPAPAASQINSYFIMPRPQQQQQQQQQQLPQPHPQTQKQQQQYQQSTDHLVGVPHQSPATISALPPMQNPMISESGRRFDELQLNTYQGMGNWQI